MTADEMERRLAEYPAGARVFRSDMVDAIAALREAHERCAVWHAREQRALADRIAAEADRDGWADQWREESEAHTATFTRMQALTRQMEKWRALAARRRDQSHHRAARADAEIRRRVKAEAERDALALRVEALEAMVRLLQYAGWDADKEWSCCPECEVPIRDPHAPGCPVATLLAPPTTEGKTTDEP